MKQRYSLTTRLSISLVSLVVSLAVLEVGLRLAGQAYLARTVTPVSQVDHSPDTARILCIGDSFTFGGMTGRHETYPVYLQETLDARPASGRVQVFNQGVCEYNSWQLLQFLPEWLAVYDPQVVVVLVGSANLFNPWGYDFETAGALGRLGGVLHGLRVVKLARLIYVNGSAKLLASGTQESEASGQNYGLDGHYVSATVYQEAKGYLHEKMAIVEPNPTDAVQDVWYTHNQGYHEAALEQCAYILQGAVGHQELLAAMGYFNYARGEYALAEGYYVRALELHPLSRFVRGQASFFYSNVGRDCIQQGRYGEAVDYLFKAIEQNPDDEYHYYAMSRAFGLQSRYSAQDIAERCRALMEADPDLRQNQKLVNHLEMFEVRGDWEARVGEWLERDLEDIHRQVTRSGATLVVQNYPVSYPHANDRLQALADEHGLPWVDNLSRFDEVVASQGRQPYLFDDDHCTPGGHRLMAENVVEVLESEGVLGP
jgi:lysophospholipase L1-like esterase/Tfp pilus assembly protein PilF